MEYINKINKATSDIDNIFNLPYNYFPYFREVIMKELDFEAGDKNEVNERALTAELAKRVEELVEKKKSFAREQETYNDDLEAIAKRLGIKKGVLSRRIALIIKEEKEGGEIKSKTDDLDFVEQYFVTNSK